MRILKKAGFAVAMSLTLAMVSPVALPALGTVTAQAATIKLNKTKASISKGESVTLKVTGASKNAAIQWASSDESVAAVSKSGKVTGKAAGATTITATVNKKKYNCAVTVRKASANKTEFGGISFSLPKGWNKMEQKISDLTVLMMMPEIDIVNAGDNITLIVEKTGVVVPDFEIVKETFTSIVKEQLEDQLEINNFKSSSFKSKIGEILEISYTFKLSGVNVDQKQYYVFLDQYMVQLTETDMGETSSDDLTKKTKSIIDSIKVVK